MTEIHQTTKVIRGGVTIPKDIRTLMDIDDGDKISFLRVQDDGDGEMTIKAKVSKQEEA